MKSGDEINVVSAFVINEVVNGGVVAYRKGIEIVSDYDLMFIPNEKISKSDPINFSLTSENIKKFVDILIKINNNNGLIIPLHAENVFIINVNYSELKIIAGHVEFTSDGIKTFSHVNLMDLNIDNIHLA